MDEAFQHHDVDHAADVMVAHLLKMVEAGQQPAAERLAEDMMGRLRQAGNAIAIAAVSHALRGRDLPAELVSILSGPEAG